MPRNVRNFWIVAEVDGKKETVETGPKAKDGGIYITIKQRDNGDIHKPLRVIGTAKDDGALVIDVLDHDGTVVYTTTTRR